MRVLRAVLTTGQEVWKVQNNKKLSGSSPARNGTLRGHSQPRTCWGRGVEGQSLVVLRLARPDNPTERSRSALLGWLEGTGAGTCLSVPGEAPAPSLGGHAGTGAPRPHSPTSLPSLPGQRPAHKGSSRTPGKPEKTFRILAFIRLLKIKKKKKVSK